MCCRSAVPERTAVCDATASRVTPRRAAASRQGVTTENVIRVI
jgi:hypothetical protein